MPAKDRKTSNRRAERAAVDRQEKRRHSNQKHEGITDAFAAITMRRLFTGAAKKFFTDECPRLDDIASIEIPYRLSLTNAVAAMALAKEFCRHYPLPKGATLQEVAKWSEAMGRFWAGSNRFLKTAGDLQKQYHNQQLASMPNSVEIKITRDDGEAAEDDPWTVADPAEMAEYEYDPDETKTTNRATPLKH